MNKGLKRPVMHALVQFPTELLVNESNEKRMLAYAIQFVNETHGDNAVFSARLDRDESGRHTVDVFYSPKYQKITKSRGEETWVSTTKHGKELCEKHRDEIERRHEGRFLKGPRQVGIAMQSEFRAFLLRKNLNLDAKIEKNHGLMDRVEPEVYKMQKQLKAQKIRNDDDAADLLKLQIQMRATQNELVSSVREVEKAMPLGSLKDKARGQVFGILERMKRALTKIGVDLDHVARRASVVIDRKDDNDQSQTLKR